VAVALHKKTDSANTNAAESLHYSQSALSSPSQLALSSPSLGAADSSVEELSILDNMQQGGTTNGGYHNNQPHGTGGT
jgi:hypothetical protein